MSLIRLEKIAMAYGMKQLYNDADFHIEPGERMGVVGINGTGKTTLLKIIAGHLNPDHGQRIVTQGLRIEYLAQEPGLDLEKTILAQVLQGDSPKFKLLRDYNTALEKESDHLLALSEEMTKQGAWDIETQVKTVLTKLGLTAYHQRIKTLSGGQRRRVALATALVHESDLLILDEPTNHMDEESIEWLETELKNSKQALIMVTHDRYFLDRVCNKIVEISHGKMYDYDGNYSDYTQAKADRLALADAMERKRQNLYRTELAWIRAGAKARSTKQKARIQRFEALKNQSFEEGDQDLLIEPAYTRLGKKTLVLDQVAKGFDGVLFEDLSYLFLKTDRVGILGPNGCGKSTLLNVITGQLPPDKGSIDIGETVQIGYFSQNGDLVDESMTAIEYLREVAEYVPRQEGPPLSVSKMMENFLFDGAMQNAPIDTFSGGEKRRLQLIKVLMQAPNVLLLDEPTNDLDIDTLKVLESYIDGFQGIVIVVSHDRYFLNRVCNKLMVFNKKRIDLVHGNYSDFKNKEVTQKQDRSDNNIKEEVNQGALAYEAQKRHRVTLSYKEKEALKTLEPEIEALSQQIDGIEADMLAAGSQYTKLQELSEKKEAIETEILEKMEYLERLQEKQAKVE